MDLFLRLIWLVSSLVLPALISEAFLPNGNTPFFVAWSQLHANRTTKLDSEVKVGSLLSDLPTPSLLLELSLAESAIEKAKAEEEYGSPPITLDEVLLTMKHVSSLEGALFVHTSVVDTSTRDKVNQKQGSGKSEIICEVDTQPEWIPGGAYLGIGLANHLVGGYYWARGMGMGASLPAHGVYFSESKPELYWKKRGPGMDATETTEESSNSNDG